MHAHEEPTKTAARPAPLPVPHPSAGHAARPGTAGLTPESAAALQRTAGNAAVARAVGRVRQPWQASGPAGTTVQRMPPKRDRDTAGLERGDSPPARRATRGSTKVFDLDKPTLTFTSAYDGPASQRLDADQSIGFTQAAALHNPAGAPLSPASNYHFWQEVTDSNVQIIPARSTEGVPSERPWQQDGPYKPPYNNAVIVSDRNAITFNDDPGFSTTSKLTAGYWLASYSVSFRWKVARNTGAFNRGAPAWTSGVVTHTLTSDFDPESPDAPAPIRARAAGNRTWTVDLGATGDDA
ncbi:hypothetical protein BM536_036695 [Streptomyces phaeoluteigriseus]|uniref:Uncharacterized protein n=1 Tax=Streptomyces phaeoluteigriseus TaxID=114686 RepID=A0A1V6MHP3_9ACTN|nr:hypothetical protein [Streptomyces phaeoluteigriseus]OQD51990.1 hypothetical protein BM536_036695 [Streptomyces phaeoluteigriseus]